MRLRLAAVVILGASCSAFSAFSNEPETSERLVYAVMVGGLKVGDAVVSLDQNSTGYSTNLKMASSGALKFVSSIRAELNGQGTFVSAPNGLTILPSSYENTWTTGDVAGKMTMTFDPATRAASIEKRVFNPVTGEDMKPEDMPWNKRGKVAVVPEKMRTNVFDPMTAFLSGRHQVMAANGKAGASFRIPIFDGSRRYDIVGKIAAVKSITINGKTQNLLPVTAKLEPVFGFQPKSEEQAREWEGKLYFTPDKRLLPVQIVAGSDAMSAVMNLSADCSEQPEACATVAAAAQIGPQVADAK
jgi:hypothetical protein